MLRNEEGLQKPKEHNELIDELVNFIDAPENNPHRQPRYFFSKAKSYYEALCILFRIVKDYGDAFKMVYENEEYLLSLIQNMQNKEGK